MTDRSIYQSGKRVGHRLVPAFKILRLRDGGISIIQYPNEDRPLDSAERTLVLAHFGRPVRARTSVGVAQYIRLFQPGSKDHFRHAVRSRARRYRWADSGNPEHLPAVRATDR